MQGKHWLALGLLACCTGLGAGQAAMAGGNATAGAAMSPAKAEDALLSLYEHELMDVVKTMPAEKFSFAPSSLIFTANEGAKYEGVRTFGQQVAHLTQANYYFFSSFPGVKTEVNIESLSGIKSKDEAISALAASFTFAHQAIATITAANAFETIKGVDGMSTRATVASFAAAHGFDHYGQMVEYLRMNGLVPPGSK